MSATLGVTTDNQSLKIGDIERRSGLYVLGKPRMGKSWLLTHLILQDIPNHGVFFLDPHGDAIAELMQRVWNADRYILLDPEDNDHTFGINLLECQHLTNQKARNDTFTRAKGVFDKLWKNTFEERPWLQLILQNTLYTFIENQGYTLAELPLFFRDLEFRNHIAGNIRYNRSVSEYWLKTFPAKSAREQNLQMEAAQTRAEIMLGHPYVADIVGQTKTTLDFQKFMDERRVIFLRLSSALSYESKKIIGTIVISELKHAVERRPPDKRHQFCIFIDEFQNFASFEDFSTLITQAPKFGVATTVAHHDRFGQLGENREIIGATAAIANKVLFQVTVKDAHEFAPEFSEYPPTEMRDEDVYAISQYPFYDLLHGHDNPQVRALINTCLRPIKERLEDIYGEKETERLMRTDDLDTSALHRIDEVTQATRRPADPSGLQASLARAAVAVLGAAGHTGHIKKLNEEGMLILATVRVLNRLFIDVMEGKVKSGSEDFSNRLIDVSQLATLPDEDRRILELYIGFAYGDPNTPRTIPFECAKRQGVFKEYVERTEREINTEYETQRAEFARHIWKMYEKNGEKIVEQNIKMYAQKRITYGEPKWTAQEIKWKKDAERTILSRSCQYAIERYERGETPLEKDPAYYPVFGIDTLLFLIKDIAKNVKPLIKRQPDDIPGCLSYGLFAVPIRKDLTMRGYKDVVDSVDALTKLCALLAKPENHLQVKTRQRGQKEVQTRTIADMVNEMVQELTELPKYTAMAKILQGQQVWKGKIQTIALAIPPGQFLESLALPIYMPEVVRKAMPKCKTLRERITENTVRHCKERAQIAEEIRQRQERWRPRVKVETPSAHTQETKKPGLPPGQGVSEPDAPPPTSVSVKKAGGKPEKREKQTADARESDTG